MRDPTPLKITWVLFERLCVHSRGFKVGQESSKLSNSNAKSSQVTNRYKGLKNIVKKDSKIVNKKTTYGGIHNKIEPKYKENKIKKMF